MNLLENGMLESIRAANTHCHHLTHDFFEDICTINELLSLSQRFEVAKMLREQKTYLEIAEKTGASTATISRVNRSLNYGNDGYDMVFARINDTEE